MLDSRAGSRAIDWEAEMSKAVPIVRNEHEGERVWFFGGGVHVWKASADETAGALLLFEDFLEAGKTTPLHIHPEEDELLYVLEGEILVHIAGKESSVGPRGFAFAPRGVAHAFLVVSETARVLCLETPASTEAFYRGASVPATEDLEREAPVDLDRLRRSAQLNPGIEIVGPPPFEQ
jgi:mannose-6-phosphate isomerase-like protein (cupin superfamily)